MQIKLFVIFTFLAGTGCASFGKKWKALVSGENPRQPAAQAQTPATGATYSEQAQMMPSVYRKYRRTTKKDLEDRARVDSRAGSLWVMEGQGAYLFSQNVVRMIGDPVGIRIEGEPHEQLAQKSKVIGDLLAQLEERRRRVLSRDSDEQKKQNAKTEVPNQADKGKAAKPGQGANDAGANRAPASQDKDAFNVKTVPTRIVERLVDGNYRVRGTQPFMIGSREYKVIVSGIIRAEDFNEDGVSATQLLDPNFDIVSSRSAEAIR
jgi:flagellar L-ring protein precursor FlgH